MNSMRSQLKKMNFLASRGQELASNEQDLDQMNVQDDVKGLVIEPNHRLLFDTKFSDAEY